MPEKLFLFLTQNYTAVFTHFECNASADKNSELSEKKNKNSSEIFEFYKVRHVFYLHNQRSQWITYRSRHLADIWEEFSKKCKSVKLDTHSKKYTPICSKLRELNYDDCRGDLRKLKKISDSTVAFALRHLPFLEYLGPYPAVETSLGIKRLYKIKAEAMDEEQRPAACERVLLKGQITNFPGT